MIKRIFGIVSVVAVLIVVVMVAMSSPKSLCFKNCDSRADAVDSLAGVCPLVQTADTVDTVAE